MTEPRPLAELVDTREPAWPTVQEWLRASRNRVEVLPAVRQRAERCLLELQVTTRSPLGAVAFESGGLLVDRGWVRVLGSGGARLQADLLRWRAEIGAHDFLIVAHDVSGGFFAVNGGELAGPAGNVFYWAPDVLEWEDLERPYSGFLYWLAQGDLGQFYSAARWPAWEGEVAAMSPDAGTSFYPPLWAEGGSAAERSRRAVPMVELWHLQQASAARLSGPPGGAKVQLRVDHA